MDVLLLQRDSENAVPASRLGKPSDAAAPRRALGDISNKALAAGKAAEPRAALGCVGSAPAKAKLQLPSELAALPISARTAEFVTEEVLALARVYAAEGVEALAGRSGQEQAERAKSDEEARAQAELEIMQEPAAWNLEQASAPRAPSAVAQFNSALRQLAPRLNSALDLGEPDFGQAHEEAHGGACSAWRRRGDARGVILTLRAAGALEDWTVDFKTALGTFEEDTGNLCGPTPFRRRGQDE